MLIKTAIDITGGLSDTEKMPEKSFNLPAKECNIGTILQKVKDSACFGCYANKNRYLFTNVQEAMYKRYEKLNHPYWVEAMSVLVSKQSPNYFRWHDSGDIQSLEHLDNIVRVCRITSTTKHWLPTREYKLVKDYSKNNQIPDNLCIRISAPMINGPLPVIQDFTVSGISKDGFVYDRAVQCPAPSQNNTCGKCRACWSNKVKTVVYQYH